MKLIFIHSLLVLISVIEVIDDLYARVCAPNIFNLMSGK